MDFTSPKSPLWADREGAFFWTTLAVIPRDTYPAQTPRRLCTLGKETTDGNRGHAVSPGQGYGPNAPEPCCGGGTHTAALAARRGRDAAGWTLSHGAPQSVR